MAHLSPDPVRDKVIHLVTRRDTVLAWAVGLLVHYTAFLELLLGAGASEVRVTNHKGHVVLRRS